MCVMWVDFMSVGCRSFMLTRCSALEAKKFWAELELWNPRNRCLALPLTLSPCSPVLSTIYPNLLFALKKQNSHALQGFTDGK